MRSALILLLTIGVAAITGGQQALGPDVIRLVVVTTPGWNAVDGTLTRYERRGDNWARVGRQVPVVVGKSGMGWDPELAKKDPGDFHGPVKHEGDGRSPAGVLGLTSTFGFAPSIRGSNRYRTLTPTTECVDDSQSRYYARIVDRADIRDADWTSSEKMRGIDGYRWGVVVAYNTTNPVAGNGSCIFLHVWSGPGKGTAGCTAMPETNIEEIVRWVDAGARTVLVQMPEEEYRRVRKGWGLP